MIKLQYNIITYYILKFLNIKFLFIIIHFFELKIKNSFIEKFFFLKLSLLFAFAIIFLRYNRYIVK